MGNSAYLMSCSPPARLSSIVSRHRAYPSLAISRAKSAEEKEKPIPNFASARDVISADSNTERRNFTETGKLLWRMRFAQRNNNIKLIERTSHSA